MKQKRIRRQPQKKPSFRGTNPRKREDGRPQGTFKRFPFDQTRIGFMLRYEMPVVYHLLRRLYHRQQPFEPDWHVIELVAEASKDPSFRKAKFSRYLEDYRRNGVYCRRGKRLTPGRKPITRAYAVARRKSISVKTAGSCSLKDGMGRAVTNCPGRLKTCLKRNGNALTDNDWHKHSYACMAVREHLSNFVFHSRCKTFPYCQMSILFRDTVSETSSPSFIS